MARPLMSVKEFILVFALSLACGSEGAINTQSWNFSQCVDEQDSDPVIFQNASSSCPSYGACSVHVQSQDVQRVGIAFIFVIVASVATTFGALAVFTPGGKIPFSKLLAGGLSMATGLMLYLAFAELWHDSAAYFCCKFLNNFTSYAATAASFFLGILLTGGLRAGAWLLRELDRSYCWQRWSIKVRSLFRGTDIRANLWASRPAVVYTVLPSELPQCSEGVGSFGDKGDNSGNEGDPPGVKGTLCTTVGKDPDVDGAPFTATEGTGVKGTSLSTTGKDTGGEGKSLLYEREESFEGKSFSDEGDALATNSNVFLTAVVGGNDEVTAANRMCETPVVRISEQDDHEHGTLAPLHQEEDLHARGPAEFREVTDAVVHDKKHLTRMGVLTGLAIAIHNFPEGVATFVGSLSSLSLGAVLAFAIAIHNIPEGICVAMPIYYATGSKWKGIFWATLSGISGPVGALLAYVALRDVFSPLVYGICFGLISGMMVYIALKELLPTAYRLTKTGAVLVPSCVLVGMMVMSLSLVLRRLDS